MNHKSDDRQFPFGVPPRGLATIALLKANFDEGNDHIGMWQPFVLDAVVSLDNDDFQVEEVQEAIVSRHGLKVPIVILRTLLKRTSVMVGESHTFSMRYRRLLKSVPTSMRSRLTGYSGK